MIQFGANTTLVSHWQLKRKLTENQLFAPLFGVGLLLLVCFCLSLAIWLFPDLQAWLAPLLILCIFMGFLLLYRTQTWINQSLLKPLANLKQWALNMRDGNLSAQISMPENGEFAGLARDINDLGESLRSLTREMDEKVHYQTRRLQQKSYSLEILYDVAASSNTARDVNELLVRYLETMANILDAHAATVRLISQDNHLMMIGSTSLDPVDDKEVSVPIERCLCAQNYSDGVIICKNKRQLCGNLLYKSLPYGALTIAIAIPLQYGNRTLGLYNLFVEDEDASKNEDIINILTNIGQHLSLAIEKARLDDDTRRLTIMQERTMLAHELHDSLAQTLASLRFRVSLLSKSLRTNTLDNAMQEIDQLKNGLDEANSELRELVSHFRVRMDERGLIPATENLVERFKKECDIAVFFQNECQIVKLPPMVEVHVLHIIQECLTNIRKHSQAKNVRILVRCDEDGQFHVLIEDDGQGIQLRKQSAQPGEHVGLTIMEERAQRIGGSLSIESEPGEGTRIELDFNILKPRLSKSTVTTPSFPSAPPDPYADSLPKDSSQEQPKS